MSFILGMMHSFGSTCPQRAMLQLNALEGQLPGHGLLSKRLPIVPV